MTQEEETRYMPQKCPYCNEELNYIEMCRSGNMGDYYYEAWAGSCPKCKKYFSWDEIYNLSSCENLKEIKELE